METSESSSRWDVPTGTIDSDAERFLLFDSVARALDATASKRPLVLIIGDAADEPSVALWQFLARKVVDSSDAGRLISATKTKPPPAENLLRCDGDYWTIGWEGKAFLLKDTKGLHYLAALLAEPGREYHALDLAAAVAEPAVSPAAASERGAALRRGLGDAGAILDAEAKAQYRRRLEDLRAELEEAERFNDTGRATRNREEIEFLTEELARATGLGGRDRKAAAAAERARANVTMAIRAALKRIAEQSPSLGRHLAATIRTGKFCSYTPDPRLEISWRS